MYWVVGLKHSEFDRTWTPTLRPIRAETTRCPLEHEDRANTALDAGLCLLSPVARVGGLCVPACVYGPCIEDHGTRRAGSVGFFPVVTAVAFVVSPDVWFRELAGSMFGEGSRRANAVAVIFRPHHDDSV